MIPEIHSQQLPDLPLDPLGPGADRRDRLDHRLAPVELRDDGDNEVEPVECPVIQDLDRARRIHSGGGLEPRSKILEEQAARLRNVFRPHFHIEPSWGPLVDVYDLAPQIVPDSLQYVLSRHVLRNFPMSLTTADNIASGFGGHPGGVRATAPRTFQ